MLTEMLICLMLTTVGLLSILSLGIGFVAIRDWLRSDDRIFHREDRP